MRAVLLALIAAGCAEHVGAPCESVGEAALDLAPSGVAFGAFVEGDPIPVGNPPQGGAPYTPLRVRVSGLEDLDERVTVDLSGVDLTDGSDLGTFSTPSGLVCANVGESAGMWLIADLHYRYLGWVLEDLPGRDAEITVVVRDVRGNEVEGSLSGALESM